MTKIMATSALVGASLIWLMCHLAPQSLLAAHPAVLGYLRAASEAAMVGGLADWFAVTALFRRPLGLPIPHTNLIQENQLSIAKGVAGYIDRQFLQSTALVEQLRAIDFAGKLSALLDDRGVMARGYAVSSKWLEQKLSGDGTDHELTAILAAAIRDASKQAEIKPLLIMAARNAAESGIAMHLARQGAAFLKGWMARNRTVIDHKVKDGSAWYIPKFVDQRIAAGLIDGINDVLDRIQDETSRESAELSTVLRSLPDRLSTDQDALDRMIRTIRAWIAETPDLVVLAASIWKGSKEMLLSDLRGPDPKSRLAFDILIGRLSAELGDRQTRSRINASVETFLLGNLTAWRDTIRTFIVATLMKQNAKDFADSIQAHVGQDLQYIRINGTVIGAAIGIALYFLNAALP